MKKWNLGRASTLALVAVFLLVACGPSDPEPEREPYSSNQTFSAADTAAMVIPEPFDGLEIVDPGWVTEVQYRDGVYLAAIERGGVLEYTAVDMEGTVLWAVERPASCTGFVVTADEDGRPIAVLSDLQTTDKSLTAATASGYDLITGEHVWGPVDVPGVYQGPGVIFADPPQGGMGETGPRVALDPTSGTVAASEMSEEGIRVLGEYSGIVLITENEQLIARNAGDKTELWSVALSERDWKAKDIRAALDPIAGDRFVKVIISNSASAIIDLQNGEIDANAREAALDSATQTLVLRNGEGLHAYSAEDQELWSISAPDETRIAAIGAGNLYVEENEIVHEHDLDTGDVVRSYDADEHQTLVVPTNIGKDGAAILFDGDRHLLAIAPKADAADESEQS